MSAPPLDDADERTAEESTDERIVELETDTGTIVYDRSNHDAWVQSSVAVSLGDAR